MIAWVRADRHRRRGTIVLLGGLASRCKSTENLLWPAEPIPHTLQDQDRYAAAHRQQQLTDPRWRETATAAGAGRLQRESDEHQRLGSIGETTGHPSASAAAPQHPGAGERMGVTGKSIEYVACRLVELGGSDGYPATGYPPGLLDKHHAPTVLAQLREGLQIS